MTPPRGTLDDAGIERLRWEVERLHKEDAAQLERIESLERTVKALDEVERKRLLTGIRVLVFVIMSLLGVIWAYRFAIFVGQQ
jgi:cytoskeletal protein RodZ